MRAVRPLTRRSSLGMAIGLLTLLPACSGAAPLGTAVSSLGPVQLIDGPSGSLAVQNGGAGPRTPVVFVHSLGGSMNHWAAQLAHLRPTRQAVGMDLRGHGQSAPARDRNYSMDAMAGDILAVADALKIDRFVLVGHSMGSSVAIAFAGRHPDRVAGLLLADPSGDFRKVRRRAFDPFMNDLRSPNYELTVEAHWNSILVGSDLEMRRLVVDDLRRTPKLTVVGGFEALSVFNPARSLRRYHGPVLAVITPLNDRPESLHKITRLDLRRMTGTSHWLQMDKPAEFNAIMDDFLTRADRPRPLETLASP